MVTRNRFQGQRRRFRPPVMDWADQVALANGPSQPQVQYVFSNGRKFYTRPGEAYSWITKLEGKDDGG